MYIGRVLRELPLLPLVLPVSCVFLLYNIKSRSISQTEPKEESAHWWCTSAQRLLLRRIQETATTAYTSVSYSYELKKPPPTPAKTKLYSSQEP